MGLITKTVKVKWNSKIKKHYEELGYVYTKMGDEFEVKVEDLTKGSHVRVHCICNNCCKDLDWTYKDYIRQVKENGETYCDSCGIRLIGINKIKINRLNNGKSFYDWCENNNRQDLLDRWDYELNGCSPKDVSYGENKKYWFKCNKHKNHHSELKNLNSITSGHKGSSECIQCNSIGQYILNFFEKDFLWKVWSDKNNISPFEVAIHSNKKVWWNCPDEKHEPFRRSCASSVKYEFRCPDCVKEREESIIEEKTRLYLEELGYEVKTEHNCTIRLINPKTKNPLPFDNEIELENGKHLIIEVHGEQHYKPHFYKAINKCTEKEANIIFHQRQLYDRYKRIKCKQAGYEYLEIPYTAFRQKSEKYKKLIDNKIKEILKGN